MKRIKYVSQWRHELEPAEIDALVEQASRKNRELGITGILMTSGRLFYQVIEGPGAEIDALYEAIAADPRHRDVLLLGVEDGIAERLFPNWSMRKVDLDSDSERRLQPARALLGEIHELHLQLEEKTHRLERAIWKELASLLGNGSGQSDDQIEH